MRALYQRKSGRDLFDLSIGLKESAVTPDRVVAAFTEYMRHEGVRVTQAQYEENVAGKLRDRQLSADIRPLLATGVSWDMQADAEMILSLLVRLLPGKPWNATR